MITKQSKNLIYTNRTLMETRKSQIFKIFELRIALKYRVNQQKVMRGNRLYDKKKVANRNASNFVLSLKD